MVFVSADRSEEAFQRHVTGMPWLTIPYEDSRNQAVKKHLGVDGKLTVIFEDVSPALDSGDVSRGIELCPIPIIISVIAKHAAQPQCALLYQQISGLCS